MNTDCRVLVFDNVQTPMQLATLLLNASDVWAEMLYCFTQDMSVEDIAKAIFDNAFSFGPAHWLTGENEEPGYEHTVRCYGRIVGRCAYHFHVSETETTVCLNWFRTPQAKTVSRETHYN